LRFLDWLGSLAVAMKTLLQTLVSVLSTTFKSRQDLDCPVPRVVHPCEMGRVVELPMVGGLHHRNVRSGN
jgi:hypothetical protein